MDKTSVGLAHDRPEPAYKVIAAPWKKRRAVRITANEDNEVGTQDHGGLVGNGEGGDCEAQEQLEERAGRPSPKLFLR